ncbi:MAG: GrpB family protein [Planctomycetota bacterium]
METPEERVQRLVREEVEIAPPDPGWPESFRKEKEHLLSCLPEDLIRRVEHIGSTAVPGLSAKPIVDMLVEVTDLQATRVRIAPVLEAQGYEYLWRPTHGDDGPPFYAWFIKRDRRTGARTHHIHMVERHFTEHWERLLFRDYLIEHPEVAREYESLKIRLATASRNDRVAYTEGKTEFILRVTEEAKSPPRPHPCPGRGAGAC